MNFEICPKSLGNKVKGAETCQLRWAERSRIYLLEISISSKSYQFPSLLKYVSNMFRTAKG